MERALKTRWRHERTILACAALGLALAACSRGPHAGAVLTPPPGGTGLPTSSSTGPASPQAPVPPESNPPGDIPDTTVFVPYHSAAGGFTIRVPEGWARSTSRGSVSFVNNLNSITIRWIRVASPPTPASARSVDVPELRTAELAFRLKSISGTTLHGQ